ncbi:AAA family ATPase [Geobacter pelophilus]|uniref:AAA family ATPase n=1 Tax=Geoanaerobacter pelophilus TaxID=60036 RepID=A0AAW4KXC1_9BACT|nr:AAA family ATPase [Geoanaerobacter pelophilus]MBT0662984.1 AAA family ATPase [Geoanaerobacter pelophilus]
MYREFYGFTEKPFSKTPDPRYLYLSRGHREALARLKYVLEEKEFAILTGEIGCGKTTISRALMDTMGESYRFCFVLNPRLTPMEFLRTVARSLCCDLPATSKEDLLQEMTDSLYRLHCEGLSPVLVIDEAQLIPDRDVYDEIRLLTNFQLDDRNLLSVILMGQPELRTILAAPQYEPFRQRVAINYHLKPLTLEETQEYLDFRMEIAGGYPGLFTPDAVQKIYEFSGGVPRMINLVATNALLEGFGREQSFIDAELVESLRSELIHS